MWRLRFTPDYLRFAWLRLRRPWIRCRGMVYLGRRVTLTARRTYGRLILGRDVRLGADCAIRAHEGTVHIGDRCVFGARVTVNSYLDIHIGPETLIADDVYIIDFDHRFADTTTPIMDQGIVKSAVRVGSGCWLGTKVTVTRGVRIGDGAVIGAGSVVTRDIPPNAIAAGVPARVIGERA
ncbi:acyltransferase [Stackebrandtia nassauensis]|uniref:Acetyltransferase (Isoleucine patch superfamily)-like protein n=1 Tax=Stackebrandtia nassauensis (strain DSM 44728 / CIP 108903 / NRRL B-16338 / NBRC 102104 / LLR-40K-21) TaxID=446470 RepID=D3Q8P6_STANL|nr:acyltransferase [Stackebrandtia nassauensis]ADD44488.1 Acetyltransferase (isoleucine patch superfamily)- like protein [Stackebrandtia nassauensis DSM 44728]